MNGSRMLNVACAMLILGLMAAIYFGDSPIESFRQAETAPRSTMGIAALIGIAFAFVAARLTIGDGRR